MLWSYAVAMALPPNVTLIDLRPAALIAAEPLASLSGIVLSLEVIPLTLKQIEENTYDLSAISGPLLVICEQGIRSSLAARYLKADGFEASAYAGGLPALRAEFEGT